MSSGVGIEVGKLASSLRRVEPYRSPFTRGHVGEKDVWWVEPQTVTQIEFTGSTCHGLLRHPRFIGIRTDKEAARVAREA